jgi:hypothetical protein
MILLGRRDDKPEEAETAINQLFILEFVHANLGFHINNQFGIPKFSRVVNLAHTCSYAVLENFIRGHVAIAY